MKIHKHTDSNDQVTGWQYWYDRSIRVWYAAHFVEEDQTSETFDSYGKEGILLQIEDAIKHPENIESVYIGQPWTGILPTE